MKPPGLEGHAVDLRPRLQARGARPAPCCYCCYYHYYYYYYYYEHSYYYYYFSLNYSCYYYCFYAYSTRRAGWPYRCL